MIVAGALLLVLNKLQNESNKGDFGVIQQEDLVYTTLESLPQDQLFITPDRKVYEDATMVLEVPAINLVTPIGNGTVPSALEKMPGLYEFSQLPAEGDVNVSIAGHRDVYGKEFFVLDKITDGDTMIVHHEGKAYTYKFYDSSVVSPDAWELIARQGFSVLTLTTCDPIGTRLNRLVVRGILQSVVDSEIEIGNE